MLSLLPPPAQQLSSPLLRQPRVLLHLLTHFVGLHDALGSLQLTCKHAQYEVRCIRSKLLEDENQIRVLIEQISEKSNLSRLIRDSICPSIYGHSDIKMTLALALFSGVPKEFHGCRIRGDINVLIVGDAATPKSQLLQSIQTLSHHSVYTHAANDQLTAENGSLVQANLGVCLIDNFEHLNDTDRYLIREAMEQSTTISKNDDTTTSLNRVRCTVIAAANTLGDHYEASKSCEQNVNLSSMILPRFDLLCIMPEVVNSIILDDADAMFQQQLPPCIPPDILRAYIQHARAHCRPRLDKIDDDKISNLYAELRCSLISIGGTPFAVRNIESLMRVAEARAKMHLREGVLNEDVDVAIQVVLESYISAQNFTIMRALRQQYEKYLLHKKGTNEHLLLVLNSFVYEELHTRTFAHTDVNLSMAMQQPIRISSEKFCARAAELSIEPSTYESFLLNQTSQLCRQHGFSCYLSKAR